MLTLFFEAVQNKGCEGTSKQRETDFLTKSTAGGFEQFLKWSKLLCPALMKHRLQLTKK